MTEMLKGVYVAQKKDKTVYYRASITHQRKHISLGSYHTMQEANLAYTEGRNVISTPGISIQDYPASCPLPFEKWVILVNFRDNGIYFSTPIYARNKFFYYYLTQTCILKFDVDDLFYYSSHKIMKRDGHLFVEDYGMQVNILGRHGIRNYAVAGRDYVFLNGDETDFRRANLQIINRYQGVRKIVSRGKTKYRARINLPGYLVIGTYTTEDEAAIAYNKAIDLLRKNGVRRNYAPNYLEGLSPSVYADIYAHIKVSDRIMNYRSTSSNPSD